MDNYEIKLISDNEKNILYNKISNLINQTFIKLNEIDKNILIKYLFKTIMIFSVYFYNDKFIEQLYLNKYQDIFSIMVLLMPFYNLPSSNTIVSLDEIFLNKDSKAKDLTSSYYVDHENFKKSKNYINEYFNSSIISISNTLYQVHSHILPNWSNIFPYTMNTYKDSVIYNNFLQLFLNKNFVVENNIYWNTLNEIDNEFEYSNINFKNTHFVLGYSSLYNCIYNFLYMDIKPIKWMIYDLNLNNVIIIPNIIYLSEKLHISMIANEPWGKLSEDKKSSLQKHWIDTISSPNINKISIKSLVMFYLRWEKDNDKLDELKISKKCLKIIKTNIDYVNEEKNELDNSNENIDLIENDIYNNNILEKCLIEIYPEIKYENIYNYIYESIQRFRYTWYGYCCLDEKKNILNEDSFFIKYNTNQNIKFTETLYLYNYKYFYITPKNIYNYCKAIIHKPNSSNNYIPLSINGKWDNVNILDQYKFISRLNDRECFWFSITQNIKKSYGENVYGNKKIMNEYRKKIIETNLFPNVIFQTLVYNGMLSYYKFNPKMTDSTIIPNKNTQYDKWESYILSNVDIKSYIDSYHAFSNTKLSIYGDEVIKTITESRWYTNFGADWIAQIQLYHHCLHNRIMYITGATGAGKSTVAPFLLVYAIKILNYNNNAKVVCTQPRTQPVKDNSEQISKNIGLPIIIKKNKDLDSTNELYKNTSIGEGILQDINYIQYKHKKGNLTDDLYHPYLRVYTDGSLYNIIKQQYFFKKSLSISNNLWSSSNMFDIILVDEAHEHNIYMDMILTLSKYAIYINNQVSLGIISATMDNDEIIYRKYFQPIDENWKAPLNNKFLNLKNIIQKEKIIPNINYIDRRIHLSIPFGGMNFDVKEFIDDAGTVSDIKVVNKKVISVLENILKTTTTGDILIFQPGESDIKKLVKELNSITPPNIIAIPFYSKLDTDILENIVKKVHKQDVRKEIRYPKNKYDITEINKVPLDELLPENFYTRFIIIATNIAEASITIDSLEFVIDTGNQKISVYDPETNQDNLEIRDIAIPNQKQRKGRIGRVKPGTVYYTYNIYKLNERVIYKINIQNINEFIIDLITSYNTREIDETNDPYKINSIDKLKLYLKNQYTVYNDNNDIILFSNFYPKQNANKIIYPYLDGKYKLETLEDNDGLFYIIHPDEDYFNRDIELNILSKDLKPNYSNKINKTINYGKINGIIGYDNLLTPYGDLINNMVDFLEFIETPIDFTKLILDCFSFNIDINSSIFKNILMFIVFKTSTYNFKISNNITGSADFLIYAGIIDDSLFTAIKYEDIIKLCDSELLNFNKIIEKKVNEIINNKFYNKDSTYNIINSNYSNILKSDIKSIKSNVDEMKKVLISFYTLKIKINIILSNTKYISKNYFIKIIDQINKEINFDYSIKYKSIINKFIIYYNNTNKYFNKNVLNEFINELNNIPDIDLSKKHSANIIFKIINVINSNPIVKNESLVKIKLTSNKVYSEKNISIYNQMSDYDKMSFLIIKNFLQNILIKIPETEFYINYFNKDINKIYMLEKNTIILNKNKSITFTSTKVAIDMRNYFIFCIDINDQYDIKNLFSINEYIINILNNYFLNINLYKKNIIINDSIYKYIYTTEKYNLIIKKIDKIIKYIDNN